MPINEIIEADGILEAPANSSPTEFSKVMLLLVCTFKSCQNPAPFKIDMSLQETKFTISCQFCHPCIFDKILTHTKYFHVQDSYAGDNRYIFEEQLWDKVLKVRLTPLAI